MKESKAVYVTKHKIRNDRNLIYQLYTQCSKVYKLDKKTDQSCQFDSKRDACTCRNRKPDYYNRLPKQIYATYGKNFAEIGIGSVKALQRRRVKRVYLPETDDRAVGNSDISLIKEKKCFTSYYDTKKTSSKCVGGILEYNTGCVLSEKCSPILCTKSGSTSPTSVVPLKNNEIGSNTIEKKFITVFTQFEDIKEMLPTTDNKLLIDATTSKENTYKTLQSTILDDKQKIIQTGMKEEEDKFSSDSLVEHVYNLEYPSEEKPSKNSLDPMENKLEREYRKIFTTKSKMSSKQSVEKAMPEFKSASVLRRRFQALRRGLTKKDEIKKGSFGQKSSSHDSSASRKDASITSDPPSLMGRSYSGNNKKKYGAILAHPVEQEKVSPYNTQIDSVLSELDNEQGVKGMFKLWGKKFDLEGEYQDKIKGTPTSSFDTPTPSANQMKISRTSKATEKQPRNQIVNQITIKDSSVLKTRSSVNKKRTSIEKTSKDKELKKEKRFFFFRRKKKSEPERGSKDQYHKTITKKPENVTAGRCEVLEGFTLNVGKPNNASLKKVAPKISEETDEITKKRWLRRFLSGTVESARSVNIRWNNAMYGGSSSTVFELIDTVYKNTNILMQSCTEMSSYESYYRSNTKNKVNFVQDIEAWMIPKTITDKPFKKIPIKINSEKNIPNNIELSVSNQRWVIEKNSLPHKIEVVLRSRNLGSNTQVSSEYLKIDIPKDFFDSTTSEESKRNQTSDEEVYKIVEYESECEQKKVKLIKVKSLGSGTAKSDIKVIVSVKDSLESRVLESRILESVIKTPPMHRDVIIQGSDVNIPELFDVIGVEIITQSELRDKRKSLIKIKPVSGSDSIDRSPLMKQKNCEFAESYLREYYRHWAPLGLDLLSCVSDSHLKSSSENSSSLNNQGDGSKSCPNIYDDYLVAAMISSSFTPTSLLVVQQGKTCRFLPSFKKIEPIDLEGKKLCKRCLPKDSLEVFKKRKLYARSLKQAWHGDEDKPVSVPSLESKCNQNECADCPPKVDKFTRIPPKNKPSRKHVSIEDCETMNAKRATQLYADKPEGILSFKSLPGKSSKHACIMPEPQCEIYSCESPKRNSQRSDSPKNNTASSPKPACLPQTVCQPLPSNVKHQPCKDISPRNASPSRRSSPPQPHPLGAQCNSTCSPRTSPAQSCPLPPELLSKGSYFIQTSPPSSCPPSSETNSSQVSCCAHSNKQKGNCSTSPHRGSSKSSTSLVEEQELNPKKCCSCCCNGLKVNPCFPNKPSSRLSANKYMNQDCSKCPPKQTHPGCGCALRKVPSLSENISSPSAPCPTMGRPKKKAKKRRPPKVRCHKDCPSKRKSPRRSPSRSPQKSISKCACPPPSVCPSDLVCPSPPCPTSKLRKSPPRSPLRSPKKSTSKCACPPPSVCPSDLVCPSPPCPTSKLRKSPPRSPLRSPKKSTSKCVCPPPSVCPSDPVDPPSPCPPLLCPSSPCPPPIPRCSPSKQQKSPSRSPPRSPQKSASIRKCPPPSVCPSDPVGPPPRCPPPVPRCPPSVPRCPPPIPICSPPILRQSSLRSPPRSQKSTSICCPKPSVCPSDPVDPPPPCPPPPCPPPPCPPPLSSVCPPLDQVFEPPTHCPRPTKPMGISIKIDPSRKLTACPKSLPECDVVHLNSDERLTIKVNECQSSDAIRENMNIKVTDEDGETLYERKDYVCKRNSMLLQDMYKRSNVFMNLTSEPHTPIVNNLHSEQSLGDSIEIQFKVRITQGDKTTEINIGRDVNEQTNQHIGTNGSGCKPNIYNVNQDAIDAVNNPNSSKNDISIKIILKNHKTNPEKRKENIACYKDFTKKISDKFHTVSTGYSDTYDSPPIFLSDRSTVDKGHSTTSFALSHEHNSAIVDKVVKTFNDNVGKFNDKEFEKPNNKPTCSNVCFPVHSRSVMSLPVKSNEETKLIEEIVVTRNGSQKVAEESQNKTNDHYTSNETKSQINFAVTSDEETDIRTDDKNAKITQNYDTRDETNAKTLQNDHFTSKETVIQKNYNTQEKTKANTSQSDTTNHFTWKETTKPTFYDTEEEIKAITSQSDTNDHFTSKKTIKTELYNTQEGPKVNASQSDTEEHSNFKELTQTTFYDTEEDAKAIILQSDANDHFTSKETIKTDLYDTQEGPKVITSQSDTKDHYIFKEPTQTTFYDTQEKAKPKTPLSDSDSNFTSKETTINTIIDPDEIKDTVIQNGETKIIESPSKLASRIGKKQLLKKIFQKAHDKPKDKDRVRELRDMLKIILTDSSDNEDPMLTVSNELVKDVTYTSLKPNFFRDTDSMNNYYRVESGSSKIDSLENTDTLNADSDTDQISYISYDEPLPAPKGCMCSKFIQKINIPNAECCCRNKNIQQKENRQDNEVNCNLYEKLFIVENTDAMIQNSTHSNDNSMNISKENVVTNDKTKKTSENIVLTVDKCMKTSEVITKDNSMETNKIVIKDNTMKTSEEEILTMDNSMTTSVVVTLDSSMKTSDVVTKDYCMKTSEEKLVINEQTVREEKVIKKEEPKTSRLKHLFSYKSYKESLRKGRNLTEMNENNIVVMNQEEENHHHKRYNAAEILQCYETKKAVLEIYAEKSFSDNGEHLVAKLPKFLGENDSEIERHFEKITSQSYRSVCSENVFYMSVGR